MNFDRMKIIYLSGLPMTLLIFLFSFSCLAGIFILQHRNTKINTKRIRITIMAIGTPMVNGHFEDILFAAVIQ